MTHHAFVVTKDGDTLEPQQSFYPGIFRAEEAIEKDLMEHVQQHFRMEATNGHRYFVTRIEVRIGRRP